MEYKNLPNVPKINITDCIDVYIEKSYIDNKEISDDAIIYIVLLHNNSNKQEICKDWSYGEEFLHISRRHVNGKAMYSSWNNWEKSFLSDLTNQIKIISKPRSAMSEKEKELMKFIKPICNILRISWNCQTYGGSYDWEIILGPHLQNIINLPREEQIKLLDIWDSRYADSFRYTMVEHHNNRKSYFSEDPNVSWMCSFVTGFMHYLYH